MSSREPEQPVKCNLISVLRWYAVYVRPRQERKAASYFTLNNIEYLLPTYRELRQWKNGCRKQLDFPIFPGYIFAKVCWAERLSVLFCPSVVRFVGFRDRPTPLEDVEIASLRSGLEKYVIRPHPYMTAGDRIHIRNGPFAGRIGILVRSKSEYRIVLRMDLIQRAIEVELDVADIDVLENNSDDSEVEQQPVHTHPTLSKSTSGSPARLSDCLPEDAQFNVA